MVTTWMDIIVKDMIAMVTMSKVILYMVTTEMDMMSMVIQTHLVAIVMMVSMMFVLTG